jgi:hypothetical protein
MLASERNALINEIDAAKAAYEAAALAAAGPAGMPAGSAVPFK